MPPTDDKRTLVATRAGEIFPTGLGGLDLTYQSRQIGDARKDLPNVWGDINTFQGIRFTPKKLIAGEDGVSYNLGPLDYEVSIDASLSDFTFNLPFALGNGQEFRVKRLDDSSNVVSIVARPGELIDGDGTVFLAAQYDFIPVSDAGEGVWNKQGSIGSIIPGDIARLSQHNQFTNVNSFTGIQVGTRTIRSSLVTGYEITELDYEILAVCDAGPLIFYLPFATGNGQIFRVKKIDETDDIATVIAKDGDLIDDSISVNLLEQFAACEVIDADANFWDNTEPIGGGSAESASPVTIEVPTGDINGTNVDFATVNAFTSITVYLNGLRQRGGGNDYTISGVNTFAMASAPLVDDYLEVEYISSDAFPEPPTEGARYVVDQGPPRTVSLQIKNSSDVWETIWTESAST